ncbi:hypothetical protein ABW20_dc0104115 [Dactylellina cionopaga]|nr:hypothetical protein ABW20_dc0104115 [Dactylellina cionopaga]
MTTVIDYHYSVPSAYAFPVRPSHMPLPLTSMVKHHPQPLTISNAAALPRGLPTYLPVSVPPPSRALSNASSSSHFQPSNRRTNSTGSSSLHRSTSNGSSGSSNAYVTTLRKQKATVWCDRTQQEDSRFLAQQKAAKAAKARAALEVARAAAHQSHHRTSESGSSVHRSKISHHRAGRKGSSQDHEFSTNRSLVAGVPARLDIEDDSSDDDQPGSGSGSAYGGITRRTNSGRSSINSTGQRRFTATTTSSGGAGATAGDRIGGAGTPQLQLRIQDIQNYSGYNGTNTSSPSSYSRSSSLLDTAVPEVPEIVDTPGTVIADVRNGSNVGYIRQDYFPSHRKSSSINRKSPSPNQSEMTLQPNHHHHQQQQQQQQQYSHPQFSHQQYSHPPHHSDNYASDSRPRPAAVVRAISSREPADLRRKGSIDDSRTATMGRVRLFVANPDQ